MEFKFTIQPYQTAAAKAVTDVFEGQPLSASADQVYRKDVGRMVGQKGGVSTYLLDYDTDVSYGNAELALSHAQLLKNVCTVQAAHGLPQSSELAKGPAVLNIDVEMETGTGKTYVYTKTMFELNKRYGWSKFVVVVPSVAIREGVAKSLATTERHFQEQYGKRIWWFVYNSDRLGQIDRFADRADICCMVVNMQAFNSSFNEAKSGADGRRGDKGARKMFTERDEFGSRRPIDVLAATRPVVILDEPQKMNGKATQEGIRQFRPLFCLNYSATHSVKHNLVYALDAVDAYKQRLVKRIAVKGFTVKGMRGTDGYLFLQEVKVSAKEGPRAVIEYKTLSAAGKIVKRMGTFGPGDSIFEASGGLEAYRDCVVAPGNDGVVPGQDGCPDRVRFLNGVVLERGVAYGDSAGSDIARIQIRETVRSHFEKEAALFRRGIKCLSLFFIDEVAKYRVYGDDGEELVGEYGRIFEEEYEALRRERLAHPTLDDESNPAYLDYLRRDDAHSVHRGYFSVDKKGRAINSSCARGSDESDDITAYDLILKNKERLLSFDEPTRFIFSHSALREGWDNPNVFQICTLKHASTETSKRQEVGRGLRLCVDRNGVRQDLNVLGEGDVHRVNVLTVIASESYETFVRDLQSDMRKVLRERPKQVDESYLLKVIKVVLPQASETEHHEVARKTYFFLVKQGLVDEQGQATQKFKDEGLAPEGTELPAGVSPEVAQAVDRCVRATYDESALNEMVTNDLGPKVVENPLNDNFKRREFQELWKRINRKQAYTVDFDQDELRRKAVQNVNERLTVSRPTYTVTRALQEDAPGAEASHVEDGSHFGAGLVHETHDLGGAGTTGVRYDLVGKVAEAAAVTRRTAAYVLKNMLPAKFALFAQNPEEFIRKVAQAIVDEKAQMVVEHICYNPTDECYDASIFTNDMPVELGRAFEGKHSVQRYVVCDGTAERSVERRFVEQLDSAQEVCVYAKLPRSFRIPTPVGDYAPDWAIAFNDGAAQHVFFVAETKGSLASLDLRGVEKCKIDCAKRLFNNLPGDDVRYYHVTTYDDLLDAIRGDEG